ncbi:Ras-like GTP-binding protein Rho1 [Dictyocoela roeselum]|nr:Ras-like GTP-binding protein Rho1 [Dictyocoela roeselum]
MTEINIPQGKVVLVGDGACGKTCLLEMFKRNVFPEDYVPTIVDNFAKDITLPDGEEITLTLWDTAGQEDFDAVRPLSYKDSDLVMLCYSIENKDQLVNLSERWVLEIGNYSPNADIFLVGLKKDIRDNPEFDQSRVASVKDGEEAAHAINAIKFLECSAKANINVTEVFMEAAKYVFNKKKRSASCWGCCG